MRERERGREIEGKSKKVRKLDMADMIEICINTHTTRRTTQAKTRNTSECEIAGQIPEIG